MANRWTVEVYNFLGPSGKALVVAVYDPPGGGSDMFTKRAVLDSSNPTEQQQFVNEAVAEVQAWLLQRTNDQADATVIDGLLEAAYP